MAEKRFSSSAALRAGWALFKPNTGFLVGATVIALAISLGVSELGDMMRARMPLLSLFRHIISFLVDGLLIMGMNAIALKLADGQRPELADLFCCLSKIVTYAVSSILYILIVLGGLILLIVPGIIWMVMFVFYVLVIVDTDAGPLEALRRSARLSKGARWELFLLMLILSGINIAGAMALLVGLLFTVPFTMLVMAGVYRSLQPQAEGAVEAPGPELPKLIS